jgi:glycosyltransferase involved in cell wall biosynthesis
MQLPLVSVVMSVRNGGEKLLDTVNSILHQEGLDFEFIIANDGSTDDTQLILNDLASKDQRIRILEWEGIGLTKSLVKACEYARGDFIARQDVSDYSLPNRLLAQAKCLESNINASMCSTHVRFITPEGVTALTSNPSPSPDSDGLIGTIHGSVMFRKSSYQRVGGYRTEFYYAQDVDLWSRLVEVGDHLIIPTILYENCLSPGSISGTRKKEQAILFKLIVEASAARRSGKSEQDFLVKAFQYSLKCQNTSNRLGNQAGGAYFIASCLIQEYPSIAKQYLEIAIKLKPFHIRARLKLSQLKCV